MSERDTITTKSISYEGVFDFEGAITLLKTLIKRQGYSLSESEHQLESKGTYNHRIVWTCSKAIDNYAKLRIEIMIKTKNLKKVVLQEGKTKKELYNGSFAIDFTGIIETDYANNWSDNPYLRFLKGVYDRFIYGRNGSLSFGPYKSHVIKLGEEINKVYEELKAFLQVYQISLEPQE